MNIRTYALRVCVLLLLYIIIILTFVPHVPTAVTIGFVNPTYEFSEPPPGSQQQGFPVCIEVSSGSIGTTGGLIVEVEWVAGTAFGEWVIHLVIF